MTIKELSTDHTLIINQIELSIKFYKWDSILSFLPEGSFLVGGYIRDIILGRLTNDVDVDIVVPSNSINIGKIISDNLKGKFIVLDEQRGVVRVILKQISIDIANQAASSIQGDLETRDFSINAVAYLFHKKCLIDPLDGIKDIKISLLRTYSKRNIVDDPLRILRCFRFVSELNFNIDKKLVYYIKQYKRKLNLVANERINYEINRIIRGSNAIDSVLLIKKFNIFGIEKFCQDSFLIDLREINYEDLNANEKQKFLPLFFLGQILDIISLEKLKYSKTEITHLKLLQKWNLTLRKINISQLTELARFELHKELEEILPAFVFYLPENIRLDWLKRWRDKNDKLFHPSNLLNGESIKKHLNINDGPFLGKLIYYLSKELAFDRLNNFDEAIYKAKQWIEQNAPKCD